MRAIGSLSKYGKNRVNARCCHMLASKFYLSFQFAYVYMCTCVYVCMCVYVYVQVFNGKQTHSAG